MGRWNFDVILQALPGVISEETLVLVLSLFLSSWGGGKASILR